MTTSTYTHKIERIGETAKECGWSIKYNTVMHDDVNQIKWQLTCTRSPEALKVTYVGNRLDDATYICGDYMSSPPHKAAVIKILTGHPNLNTVNTDDLRTNRTLPFDPAETPAREILTMLLSRKITWISGMSQELESERIDVARNKGSQYYRILRLPDGRRYIEFITHNAFRAVYLDAIVSVN